VHVIATAGHVDHGKSTLVRALTGMEPDRWAEERRRGMTIDLGFAWTDLPSGATVAFVDVPGHERFVPNMLAGIGPVPAALVVVAADEGWMPQSAEHLAALHALGVRRGLLAVTRADLADPAPALAQARERLAATSLGDVEAVALSAVTGEGLDRLRAALDRLVATLPEPDADAPVRLWVDRSFTVRGSGTVVTGTLAAGRIRAGDELQLAGAGRTVRVRGLQSLGASVPRAEAVARVALNLRGADRDEVSRGDALVTPGAFADVGVLDVRVDGDAAADVPAHLTLHIGSAAVPARVRPLGGDTARLTLARALPLRVGDRGLLRDPGRHHVVGGAVVLDVAPPALDRRGAAAARARDLAESGAAPDAGVEVRRRGLVRRGELERMGIPVDLEPVAGDWLADPHLWAALRGRLPQVVSQWDQAHALDPGMPVEAVRRALDLPDRDLVAALADGVLPVRDGRVRARDDDRSALPPAVAAAVQRLRGDLTAQPFAAPDAARLDELGLGARELAAAVRAGALLRVADRVVLLPDAVEEARRRLSGIPAPFTLSEARAALGTSRRVAVPLLELLDRERVTERLPDDRRRLRS
jgi:selenocysteine-specific elongation factor